MIGIEEKDMIINRIPAKTWNHLHMNQSKVGEVVINRTGELNASVNDVSLIDDGKLNNGELDNIIGGCGQEITEAAKKSQAEPVYYITDRVMQTSMLLVLKLKRMPALMFTWILMEIKMEKASQQYRQDYMPPRIRLSVLSRFRG